MAKGLGRQCADKCFELRNTHFRIHDIAEMVAKANAITPNELLEIIEEEMYGIGLLSASKTRKH